MLLSWFSKETLFIFIAYVWDKQSRTGTACEPSWVTVSTEDDQTAINPVLRLCYSSCVSLNSLSVHNCADYRLLPNIEKNHVRNKWLESVEVNTEWVTETKTALLSGVGTELVWTVLGVQELQASVSFLTESAVISSNYSLLKASRDCLNDQQWFTEVWS